MCLRGPCYIFEEFPSDDDSATSNNSDNDDEDYVENVSQGENTSSDDEEIDEIQYPSTSLAEVKGVKYTKKIDLLQNSRKHIPVKTEGRLYRRCSLCSTRKDVHRSR
ncbi:hypothetical protein TNIN_438011 [Trichonephila inaurata madagascariensis]|uniref:Uncharacterized protein n=1 Tax=Trichonephila inaurata madagascariensis TaxID=2747483 RepID=A0A8X6XFH2_9ARAC|nr:hypothetical protein TNIN_438011 [Trichonephila inaurata madagascariensis]